MCISYLSLVLISLDTFLSCTEKKEVRKKEHFFSFIHSFILSSTRTLSRNRSHETPSTPHCDSTRIVLVHFLYFTCSFRLLFIFILILFFFLLFRPHLLLLRYNFHHHQVEYSIYIFKKKCFWKASKCYWYSSRE